MSTLVLAAGGGGDAVGALLLRRLIPQMGPAPLVATLAWERLRVDPVPGPRGCAGFTGLGLIGGRRAEIRPTTDTLPAGCSSLPRLAAESPARLFLLDPHEGAKGLARQVDRLTRVLDVERLVVVDVGGDVVASGSEPTLRSPLADALVLGAAESAGIPGEVVVAGPGLDGELDEGMVHARLRELSSRLVGAIGPEDVVGLAGILDWHPTEASALLAAAGLGVRGNVSIGRGDAPVPVGDHSPEVWATSLKAAAQGSPLVDAVRDTASLDAAHDAVARESVSELTYERAKAAALASQPRAHMVTVPELAQLAANLHSAGADYATSRSLAERLRASGDASDQLTAILATQQHARRGPLWNLNQLLAIAA